MFSLMSDKKGAKGAPAANDVVIEGSDRGFMKDVIEASRDAPVIVDFWAPWCGPCKTLGPLLEKVVRAAKGAVKLVKIDTDKNPSVAGQLRVQSIPAVYAFYQGRPVDAFMGAQPEPQVRAFVDRLVKTAGGGAGADGLEDALAQAKEALDAGDLETASEIYAQIVEAAPETAAAHAGLVRCLIAARDLDRAAELLERVPADLAKDPEIAAVKTALGLAREAAEAGPVSDLKRKVEADPADIQARFDLANALYADGDREGAVNELLECARRDRAWNEEAARKQLVKLFEAMGPTDPLTVRSRRKLSSLLFS